MDEDAASSPGGTLHVCAVPIGNLEDASPRLRRVLASVQVIACEDTRTTSRLLDLLDVSPRPRLLAHHDHNERASARGIVELLLAGQDVALVSDAGTPSVSDPGAELVHAAHAAGVKVVAIAGPSSVAAAISVAGGRGDGYRFVGFLPRSRGDMEAALGRHASEVLVAFESPRRVRETLGQVAGLQPDRIVTVCRELTKLHEQVVRGTAADVADALDDEVRGEVVLVLDALPAETVTADPRSLALAQDLVAAGVRLKDATRIVATHLGGSSRELYDEMHSSRDTDD